MKKIALFLFFILFNKQIIADNWADSVMEQLLSINSSSNALECEGKTVVNTTTGTFCSASDSPEDINVYKGIKYAKGGKAYRWQSPVAADDFLLPKEAGSFGDICAQIDISLLTPGALDTLEDNENPISVTGSEDCLFLNIYTPKNTHSEKKTVLIWFHGGAFLLGSGSSVTFDPTRIVELEDIVVVTINYRLGIFGFLNLPDEYKREGVNSGNFGLQDQAMAIKWVYENIDLFGGDKEKITIMGESAGAMSVGFHLVNNDIPTSNYFRAAIMQSPYMGFPVKTEQHARDIGSFTSDIMLAECQTVEVTDPIQCFYDTLSTEDVIVYGEVPGLLSYLIKTLSSGSFSNIFPYEPYIDNEMVKSNLIGGEIKKNLLIGNNKSESNIFLSLLQSKHDISTELAYELFITTMFRDLSLTTLLQMYPFDKEKPLSGIENLMNDYAFKCASKTFIEKNNFADKFIYKFDFESGFNRWQNGTICDAPAVCHAADIPYTFDQFYFVDTTPIPDASENERNFSTVMISHWSDFANNLSLSGFEPYDKNIENFIEINNTAPYFFEQSGTFSSEHHCSYWNDYYKSQKNPSHGRNARYRAPPVQTRTCGFLASGSSVVLAVATGMLFVLISLQRPCEYVSQPLSARQFPTSPAQP